jgi:hypothetical protein
MKYIGILAAVLVLFWLYRHIRGRGGNAGMGMPIPGSRRRRRWF